MPYDPTLPLPNSRITSSELRSQLQGLAALIAAVPAGPPGPPFGNAQVDSVVMNPADVTQNARK